MKVLFFSVFALISSVVITPASFACEKAACNCAAAEKEKTEIKKNSEIDQKSRFGRHGRTAMARERILQKS